MKQQTLQLKGVFSGEQLKHGNVEITYIIEKRLFIKKYLLYI